MDFQQDREEHRLRIVLTAQQAADIYKLKPLLCETSDQPKIRGQSIPIANQYGVSPKTIRDIWNRRTWVVATKHLYTEAGTENGCGIVSEVGKSPIAWFGTE